MFLDYDVLRREHVVLVNRRPLPVTCGSAPAPRVELAPGA